MANSNVKAAERIIVNPYGRVDFMVMSTHINITGDTAFVIWTSEKEQKPEPDYRYAVQIYRKSKYDLNPQPELIASGGKEFSYTGASSGHVYDTVAIAPAATAKPDLYEYTCKWQAYVNDWEIANGEVAVIVND